MIIFGTRGVTMTHEKGVFCCPSCGPGSNFRWRRVRRFFTLYFIPLIPLDLAGEYIECGQCKGSFHLHVLDYDPAAQALKLKGDLDSALRLVMIAALPAAERSDPGRLQALAERYGYLGHEAVPLSRWQQDAESYAGAGNLPARLRELNAHLNNLGREALIEAAHAGGRAAGEPNVAHLAELASLLGLTPTHFQGLMHSLESPGRLPTQAPPPPLPSALS